MPIGIPLVKLWGRAAEAATGPPWHKGTLRSLFSGRACVVYLALEARYRYEPKLFNAGTRQSEEVERRNFDTALTVQTLSIESCPFF